MMHEKRDEGLRVLIVDDSALSRRMLQSILEKDPAIVRVETATDAYSAVEKIRRETPDVILLDVEMPRMNGLKFLKRIMAQHPLPVIVCSAHIEGRGDALAREALALGALDIIAKPGVEDAVTMSAVSMRILNAIHAAAGKGGELASVPQIDKPVTSF
ncbi:two-component system chemotaxis response regulator CheB [Desulfobotulus alkaliphilus]|uniref:Two-component system chemotaxis response regulator CheB n=1 Tax=Desulfobotulus alkaliphilus TaxID=622671 RepID=A0A562RQ51_9BACT|nr:response regulator [Desulfobotulus alkaliphilus]TWI71219.1 two-component system chemotaxis response regulator CheB [Desulfobotulus alkaliphilus]